MTHDALNATDASKAASILHHTWGIDGYTKALEVYNTIGASPDLDVVDYLESIGAGIWEPLDQMPVDEWWENVETLALSIAAAQAWQQARGETK